MGEQKYPNSQDFEPSFLESIFFPEKARLKQKMYEDEITRQRNQEDWEKKQEYMSPMDRAFARKYFKENPSEIGEFQGIPGIGMEAQQAKGEIIKKSTGGQAQTSQGVNAPSTYTPPTAQPSTVGMGAKGFTPLTGKEQIVENAAQKYLAGEATEGERKLLGVDKEEKFVESLRKVDSGAMDIKELETKYPEKTKKIKKYQISKMDYKTQAVTSQIEKQIKNFKAPDGAFDAQSYYEHVSDIINQLIDDREEAQAQGINVDAILEALGISVDEWQKESGEETTEKKQGWFDKIWEILGG